MKIRAIIIVIGIIVVLGVVWQVVLRRDSSMNDSSSSEQSSEQAFKRDGLQTNTTLRSIELSLVLDGGPGKDGIPAIDEPKFISISEAEQELQDESLGMLVVVGETSRFYPYNIMNWHEIVNDTIEGKSLAITFCPLCGSAIVFDATVDGQKLSFGVSGKLFESNLLMYDRKTESLWSQSRGEAVIGDMLGSVLELYPSQFLRFAQVREQFPNAEILSRDTGYSRSYDFDPYSGYEDNDSTFFPISVRDDRFPAKEIFYIVPVGEQSVALKLKDLTEGVVARVVVDAGELVVSANDGILDARLNGTGETIPNYVEMWFSWAIHHQDDGVVWQNN